MDVLQKGCTGDPGGRSGAKLKQTIEGSISEVQKVLQTIAGSPEHKNRAVVDLNGRLVSNPKGQTQ